MEVASDLDDFLEYAPRIPAHIVRYGDSPAELPQNLDGTDGTKSVVEPGLLDWDFRGYF